MYRLRYSFTIVTVIFTLFGISDINLCSATPAIFVFGDSLLDVGNNNYLKTLAKVNFKPYGIDFGRPTGRFTNGRTMVDILGELIGVDGYIPPFLDPNVVGDVVLKGVNYASGSAGILNRTGKIARLYEMDARKFIVADIGPIGCTPGMKDTHSTESPDHCHEPANKIVQMFNTEFEKLIKDLGKSLKGTVFVYVTTYHIVKDIIDDYKSYGFENAGRACCRLLGKNGGLISCNRLSRICPDRSKYVFWDGHHPTDAANVIVAKRIFDGTFPYVSPINVRKLLKIRTS